MIKQTIPLALLAVVQFSAQAENLGAHVHGEAILNIVQDGEHVNLTLETPAMNVMGFEHEPKTEEHLDVSHNALHALKDAKWLTLNGGECHLEEVDVDWKYAEAVHDHYHSDDKKEHKHDEHKHDDGHSDVRTAIEFHCEKAQSLESVDVKIFSDFGGFEKINVQWIKGDKQGSDTLTPDSNTITFK